MISRNVEAIELNILLDTIRQRAGHDFSGYDRESLQRRISYCLSFFKLNHISELIPLVLHETGFINRLISMLTVSVTAMFRDPLFYRYLRQEIVPKLRSHPFVNIWIAGCATGEEVYSIAIILQEEGLLENSQIYATDIDSHCLTVAKQGVYSTNVKDECRNNYFQAGGDNECSNYFQIEQNQFRIGSALRQNIVFANHNLISDQVFAEMNLILCRNVMIYFNAPVKRRVLQLFSESMARGGVLCLGNQEGGIGAALCSHFDLLSHTHNIYRKISKQEEIS